MKNEIFKSIKDVSKYIVRFTDNTFTDTGIERISGYEVWADNEQEATNKALEISIRCKTGTTLVYIRKVI